ncbi:MAG: hypothetical protein HY043_09540 [Verrucomicrobia bacterium]|nr:hypothetical protein [Verrucomicrobiota bacterium]
MTTTVAELVRISRSLPPRKAAKLLDYARSLDESPLTKKARPAATSDDGDKQWERIIGERRVRPKLTAKIKAVEKLIAQGKDAPLDWERL